MAIATQLPIKKRSLCCTSITAKCLRTQSGLLSPNLIDQSSCRIPKTQAKARPVLHDDWSIRMGENRPDRALKHLEAMLLYIFDDVLNLDGVLRTLTQPVFSAMGTSGCETNSHKSTFCLQSKQKRFFIFLWGTFPAKLTLNNQLQTSAFN